MAYVLLGILFALIAAVLALPHIGFVRRLAGVEEEQKIVRGPVVTDNYRRWMLRPVARTADGFPSSARRRFDPIKPVTVLGSEQQGSALKGLPYPPRGIRIYGTQGAFRTGSWPAGTEESCRVNTDLLPERRAGLELGIVLGDRQLLDNPGNPSQRGQQASIAAEE